MFIRLIILLISSIILSTVIVGSSTSNEISHDLNITKTTCSVNPCKVHNATYIDFCNSGVVCNTVLYFLEYGLYDNMNKSSVYITDFYKNEMPELCNLVDKYNNTFTCYYVSEKPHTLTLNYKSIIHANNLEHLRSVIPDENNSIHVLLFSALFFMSGLVIFYFIF